MDSAEQAAGEKRVMAVLIEPLMRRGLAKPSSLTKAQFDDMCQDLCGKLAYMSEANLAALEETTAANPGGKDADRFPIANRILEWAGQIQPPGDDASPLMRAVFSAELGRDALADGWAPELRHWLRQNRRWPVAFVVNQLKDQAREHIRRLMIVEENMAAGREISADDAAFRVRRRAALAKCDAIALVAGGAA